MKFKFKRLISYLYDIVENYKGDRKLVPIELINNPEHRYDFRLSDGTTITIFCEEERYKLSYNKWWIKSKTISVYRVYSLPSNSVLPEIKDKFHERELIITNLWHSFASIEKQKKAAINAYIDIVIFHSKK